MIWSARRQDNPKATQHNEDRWMFVNVQRPSKTPDLEKIAEPNAKVFAGW